MIIKNKKVSAKEFAESVSYAAISSSERQNFLINVVSMYAKAYLEYNDLEYFDVANELMDEIYEIGFEEIKSIEKFIKEDSK